MLEVCKQHLKDWAYEEKDSLVLWDGNVTIFGRNQSKRQAPLITWLTGRRGGGSRLRFSAAETEVVQSLWMDECTQPETGMTVQLSERQ